MSAVSRGSASPGEPSGLHSRFAVCPQTSLELRPDLQNVLAMIGRTLSHYEILGFGVTTWVCWQALAAILMSVGAKNVRPTFGMLVLAVAGGMGFGALNEVIEFVATLMVPNTNVGGYVNTGWDLVANLIGATVAATLIYLGASRR